MANPCVDVPTAHVLKGSSWCVRRAVRRLPTRLEHFVNRKPDVLGDLAEQGGGNVPNRMERDRGTTSVAVSVLSMGAALSHEFEAQSKEHGLDLTGLQDRDGSQSSGDPNCIGADELGIELRITILQEHLNNLFHVVKKFIDGGPLGVGTRPSGDVSNIDPGIGVEFDDSCIIAHAIPLVAFPIR